VRKQAIAALGNTQNPLAVVPLADILNQGRFFEKEAIMALGDVGDESAVDALIGALASRDFTVRKEAVISLGATGDSRAVEPLVNLLRSKDGPTTRDTIEALGAIGDARAAEGLVEILDDRMYKKEALAVLEDIDWQPTTVRHKVIYSLAKGQWSDCVKLGRAAVDPLIEQVRKGNSEAAKALGDIGDKSAIPVLVEKLRDWAGGRDYAAALEKLGWRPETLSDRVYFMIGLRDRDALKRLYARDSRVRTILLDDLNSDNSGRIIVAAQTFIGLARTDMVPHLIACLRSIKNEYTAINLGNLLLASGNQQLAAQARQWGESKGYEIVSTHMPGSASWGSW
jgi:HEAT repeat protein